ncbi:8027_t:CDS:2 [Ambispora gerdemannii]|uniref:mitochondrial processing peptidase n=1 Tax=Ambispora gerdemannii TaxID=144530 RepID=A0A9N8V2X6_9GLOM|nr:8027_t:CDS:2 [Ambispora gerdemannii]
MASRLLSKALRGSYSRGLTKQLVRPFASEVNLNQPITRSSLLPNGLTVATETNPYAQTATVGIWIDAGSRAENFQNNGAAHFLEHMAFKGTNSRSQHQLELFIENIGAHLNAYTSREQTVYYARTFKNDANTAVEILSDILQNSTLDAQAIEREREVILREQEEVDKLLEEVVFDHLHATAFQGHSLGRTILGPKENILTLKRNDLLDYIAKNYTSDRMVLVGTGGVDHDELVKLAEKHFSSLPISPDPTALGAPRGEQPPFTGSEVRVRNDELPQAHIAIAVEGVGWTSPDYYPLLVAQSIIGTWDRSLGSAPHLSSRLSYIVHKNQLANSFQAFNTSYSDTGLFGIYLISENKEQLDDLVHFTCKEFWRLHTSVTEAEVERAKQQLKASLLLSLDGTTAVAEDIGRQLITTGKRNAPKAIEEIISKITVDEVRSVAGKYLWDQDVAVVGVGPVEGLPDYNRLRGDMATNRF